LSGGWGRGKVCGMESRIDQTFARLRGENRAAFVAYLAAGDPTLAAMPELVAALERAGADIIELGVPFSDPLADGAVNQAAADRALRAGATNRGVLETVAAIRRRSAIPLVLFTYLNPVYAYGFEAFHRDAAAAGADGILALDLPPDEAERNTELLRHEGLQQIRLVAPTTPAERLALIAGRAEGFIYYVSREGVTGVQDQLAADFAAPMAAIRGLTPVPVCVGFGIHTPEQAATVARSADGVVVGSALVRLVAGGGPTGEIAARLEAFARPLAAAIHDARG
jgi:tryptophan synthase alpha chain